MSLIRVEDVAFVRFRAPDLGAMRTFLEEFGLILAEASERRLVMRGRGPVPVAHVTELGAAGFAGVALRAGSLADLERLAAHDGAAVEALDLPGGGARVMLADPDGHAVEVVAGQAEAPALPVAPPQAWNQGSARGRLRAVKRVAPGPATVLRLGHVVLNVSDFRESEHWYKTRFGFITSDEVQVTPAFSLGAFLRCDRGDAPTDHHSLFLAQSPKGPGFNHAAFEVADLDDLMRGHQRLKDIGAHAEWGVGRHILGSQVFDYWRDPFGHTLEHWTDGDLFTAGDPPGVATLQDLLGVQWGPAAPPTMA
ncbi:VOC family protein [Zavarzinia sp. CC-PAN008]|uniref:VOC family protein n=1 Tax=Zavarzinia sp. CC-PAN008 TaxID=3243332 RepID=UPI003F74A75E